MDRRGVEKKKLGGPAQSMVGVREGEEHAGDVQG